MRRTKEDTEETRKAILAAAEELFLDRGYSAVSLDDVAQAAGFTRGAIHWHFRNKLGLLIAIHEHISLPVQELVGRLTTDSRLDPVEEWKSATIDMFRELENDPRRQRLMRVLAGFVWLDGTQAARDKRRHFDCVLRSSIGNILTVVQERGRLKTPWDPQTAAMAFHALIVGMINEWLLDNTSFSLRGDALRVVESFIISVARPA